MGWDLKIIGLGSRAESSGSAPLESEARFRGRGDAEMRNKEVRK